MALLTFNQIKQFIADCMAPKKSDEYQIELSQKAVVESIRHTIRNRRRMNKTWSEDFILDPELDRQIIRRIAGAA
tara:strand:- start:238 stop:462 length:225 start_codon:yes stop_codon:yes gene_type:complete